MDDYMAAIRLFAFAFTPLNYLPCDGSILPIQQNEALFSLIGTTYGGNGTATFALPDLRKVAPATETPGGMKWYICTSGIFPARP